MNQYQNHEINESGNDISLLIRNSSFNLVKDWSKCTSNTDMKKENKTLKHIRWDTATQQNN